MAANQTIGADAVYGQTMRYQVQQRWVKAPPPPYGNPWEPVWSFDDLGLAREYHWNEAYDTDTQEYRIFDTEKGVVVP